MDRVETLEYCLRQIKDLQKDYSLLQQERAEALRFYNSDHSIVPIVQNRSQATTTDLFDVVEWVKPSILEIFTSGEEIVSLQPETEEDVQPVKRLELLVNKQLRGKNNWFVTIYDAFTDGLILKTGIIKYQWVKETKTIDREYEGLNELEYQAKISEPNFIVTETQQVKVQEAQVDEFGEVISPPVYVYNVKGKYVITDEYPLIEAVPPEDVGFKLNARKIENTFVYHRVRYNKYEFSRKYGKEIADKIASDIGDYNADNVRIQRFIDLGADFFYNKDKEEYNVYECFYPHPETLEPWVTIICGNEVLVNERNKYDRPPFEIFTPIRLSHRICGKSFYDLLKEIQKIRTALLRQILDNVYMSNYRRYFGDPDRINLDDYFNNNSTNAFIRVRGNPADVVMPEIKAPLPPEVFNFYELMNVEKDYHSGVPRSFQGVNPNVLNETFRGQAQQISQASQRIQLLARLMAETFIAPLVRDIVDLNLKFLQKRVMIRHLNEWIEVTPDNIIGKYDVEVKVGLGTGNKELQVAHLQQVLGLYAQLFKSGIGIVTAQNVYHAMKELIKAMGYRNTSDFVTDPQLVQNIQTLIVIVNQVIAQTGLQDPQIMELIQRIMASMGMRPEQQQISGRTMPGQNVPRQPLQPLNPMQHRGSAISGGEYWA